MGFTFPQSLWHPNGASEVQVGARGATFYLARRAEEGERGRKREEGGNGGAGEIVFDSISRALGVVATAPPSCSITFQEESSENREGQSIRPSIRSRRNATPDSCGQIWPLAGKLPLRRRRFRYVRRVSQSRESRLTISALFHFVAPGRRYNRGPTKGHRTSSRCKRSCRRPSFPSP